MYTKEKIKQNLSWVVKADQEDKVIDKQELNLIWALSEFAETTLKGDDLEGFQIPRYSDFIAEFDDSLIYFNDKDLEGVPEGLDLIDAFSMEYNLNTRQENKLREIVSDANDAVTSSGVATGWTIQWEKK